MLISLDCESTGIDIAHGALPFLVTTADDEGTIRYWEWDVDPLTRRPQIPDGDLAEIAELIEAAELVYLHNSKFDHRMLAAVGINLPWAKVRDTLIASHLLASNHRHDLTWCCIEYLGVDIEPHELLVEEVVRGRRAIVKRQFPCWKIATEGAEGMPSVKSSSKRDEDKPWKNDMWLPRALALELSMEAKHLGNYPDNWETACRNYANADSAHTLPLGLEMERIIKERGYWNMYLHRLHLPRVDAEMESFGVTARGDYTEATAREYGLHIAEAEAALVGIAAGYGHELELAQGAAKNDNMRDFFYGMVERRCPRCKYVKRVKHWNGEEATNGEVCPKCAKGTKRRAGVNHKLVEHRRDNLALPVVRSTKAKNAGNATLDGDAMKHYITTLDDGPALEFIEILDDKTSYDTALSYMEQYRRYWVPVKKAPGYYRIHGSINPCGTDHLRQAMNSPNLQNVAGETKEISNRACFGPLPDREWWRMDFKSIENRLPVYESGEPKMIEVFERPDEPPYWGRLYYLTASVLYPDEFFPLADAPDRFKDERPRLYKQSKFFVLARQYGCGRAKGDLLSKVRNSFDLVESEFPLMAALQAKYLKQAEVLGYVETLPDRTIDPERGYPILASRTDDGRVLSTTPFNYHISGTACQVKNVAMIRCTDRCAEWRADGFDAHVALEVHDEILFDFPRGATMEENLPLAMELRAIMEGVGGNLVPPIPTPVSMEYHTHSWAEGVAV